MSEPTNPGPGPGPGRSTSDAAVGEIKKSVAKRNEAAHKAARALRSVRDREQLAVRRKWDLL